MIALGYEKTIWKNGDLITADKMNHAEDGIYQANETIHTLKIKQTVRFVVATTTAGWTEADCDYLCDGTDDQIEINKAIQELPEWGGEIKILDGTYNITSSIFLNKKNVKFNGSGWNTVFKRMWNESNDRDGVIFAEKCSNFIFSNFLIEGNKSSFIGSGLVILPNDASTEVFYGTVQGVSSQNNSKYGFVAGNDTHFINLYSNICVNNDLYAISLQGSSYSNASNNLLNGNTNGISLDGSVDCVTNGNIIILTTTSSIHMNSATKKCAVIGNVCIGKAPIIAGSGNIVDNNVI